MARDDSQLDKETFDRVLAEELAKGTDRRIAEGRARAAALKAYRKAHGIEPEPARQAGAPSPAAAATSAAGGTAAGGNGSGDGEAAAQVPATVGAAGPRRCGPRPRPPAGHRPPSRGRRTSIACSRWSSPRGSSGCPASRATG